MLSRFFVLLLGVGALLGPPAAVADEESKFVGAWKGRVANYDEIWAVKNNNGTWSINGKLRLNGEEAGAFIGADIKASDGTLTFTRKFVKNPNAATLLDDLTIVVKPEGENLSYSWSSGGKKGSHALEKYDGKEKPADGEKPAADALGKLRGVWTADVATGFRVVMQITMKNDKVEVSATYTNKKGQFAGSFVGVDVAVRDGVLTFSQKFVKKPVSSWGDGKLHTLESVSDNVLKFSWKDGGTENFTRAKK